MALNPYQKYQENRIEGASQGEMIVMLYEGAIRFMNQGIIYIEQKNIEKANESIIKAQRIVNELQITLNFEAGGEIAENLYRLYDFCMQELIRANIKKDSSGLTNSIQIFEELLSAWKEIVSNPDKTIAFG
ncbi:flagellar export chaperone FliS [bacterium]|nr:flagellar export chaperone FliS [bacterium]